MGQYWYPVNLDKKEFIHPHKLGVGLKLWEQFASQYGTASALIMLCAAMPETRGGGDLDDNLKALEVIGRWAGDRVALVGDYAEDTDLPLKYRASKIYEKCSDADQKETGWTDISEQVCEVLESELSIRFEGTGWRKVIELSVPTDDKVVHKALRPDMMFISTTK